jgi:hypothetical protein
VVNPQIPTRRRSQFRVFPDLRALNRDVRFNGLSRPPRRSQISKNGEAARRGGLSRSLGLRLRYSAFAKTFRAGRRINLVTRLGWLFNLFNARAVAGRANYFRDDFRFFLHDPQYLKRS